MTHFLLNGLLEVWIGEHASQKGGSVDGGGGELGFDLFDFHLCSGFCCESFLLVF